MMQGKIEQNAFFWILQGLCTLHRKPFSLPMAQQQIAAPYTPDRLAQAVSVYGFDARQHRCKLDKLHKQDFPLLAWLHAADTGSAGSFVSPVLILQADTEQALLVSPEQSAPVTVALRDLAGQYTGQTMRVAPQATAVNDPDQEDQGRQTRTFGFRWFIPELLKHRKLWNEVLLASLVIQLIALATPLFTQIIIDKVVVHRTQSTLIVIVIGMAVFMLFSALLSWLRQYLILHTGNRVDAVLGSAVFERLFKLPPLYFQQRPTGVIAARLHGVETIREFIAGTAVALVLDLPFLLIFVGIMLYYSVTLTCIVLAILVLIVTLSLVIAPMFQTRLQEQFQYGARNQAFLTEYVSGMETVKSLQMEPQLGSRFGDYLSSYLSASFNTRQLANSYNVVANTLEQLLTLAILCVGAWMVMNSKDMTIGMLVAFQMFASRLSGPMLRMVGLWQEFQQASIAVKRLGDVMNAPAEPYALTPARESAGKGRIEIKDLSFRYGENLPYLFRNLSLAIEPGQCVALMGPSGCGKSTLAKLLQGFYQPTDGGIQIDGHDIRYLSANELRQYFGVVPQETFLFSGTIYDNLIIANPHASFGDVVQACKLAEIHATIETLPEGYKTLIGEHGAGLSGGQKQRIA